MKHLLHRLFACTAATVCLSLSAADIASSSLKAVFNDGRLVSLTDRSGRDFVSARNITTDLWTIQLCRAGQFAEKKTCRASQAKKVTASKNGDKLTMTWSDFEDCLDHVTATFNARSSDPAIRCRITAVPQSGWALVETQFPCFAMNECLGSTPTDDAVVMGTGHGGLVRFPMNPSREYWKNRLVGHSPGNLVAQFGCFYDERSGLFTMAEDAEGNEKELLMDRWWRVDRPDGSYTGGDFLLRWSRFEYSETADSLPYDIILRAFANPDGDDTTWYDAADIYKSWALQQPWCRRTFLQKTDFLPSWTREAPVVMGFNRNWLNRQAMLKDWLANWWSKKYPQTPLITIMEGWEHHGDWITTEYFPIYPNEKTFADIISWLKAANGHFWPWPGGHHWNVQVGKKDDGSYRLDFSDDFYKRVAPHAIADPNGKVHLDKLSWLGGGVSATLCPADKWTVNWWNRDIACELVKRGADLVQADQDVGARVPTCWSTGHGHKPGPGKWLMQAQRHQFETMIAEMRSINPSAMFSFEEMHEYFNDIYAFCDYRNCRYTGPEWASVWNYLYHEYVPPFQSGSEQYSRWFWMAFCAADGQMPRLPTSSDYYILDESILPNANFEEIVSDGHGFTCWEKPETHEIIRTDAPEGKMALRIKANGKRKQVARNIAIDTFWKPNTTYRISVWLKNESDNASGNSLNVSALKRVNNAYQTFGSVRIIAPPAAQGWQRLSQEFTIEPGAVNLRFMLDAYDNTAFLADDITFEEKQADGSFAPVRYLTGNRQELLDFVDAWIKLYRGEGRKWLAYGRQLHPPKLQCELIDSHETFRSTSFNALRPVVFATAWEAADASRALMFANATAYPQKIAYRWNKQWSTLELKPHELKLMPLDKKDFIMTKTDLAQLPAPTLVQSAKGYNSWPFIQNIGKRLVCLYSRGREHNISETCRGVYACVSDDDGKTWQDESVVVNSNDYCESAIGKGCDENGNLLLWVRCIGKDWHHDLYRSADGVNFERIAVLRPNPMPMQITDVMHIPGKGLMCFWFAGRYRDLPENSWGTLTSSDNGVTWIQHTVEKDLKKEDWPTEQCGIVFDDGRILAISRCEICDGSEKCRQFQLQSTDFGQTWTKMRTNIGDVQISTPSLLWNPETKSIANYYYHRGKGILKCRTVALDDIWDKPLNWPEPDFVASGSDNAHHAGNVNCLAANNTHYCTYYSGNATQTDIVIFKKKP